ncbi:hypothetical protein A6U86_14545 [Rhizobium sp. AC27/96]|nr:hypothetical protein A6U86_14545 [Rhizobium sp. AC27/96]
MLDLEQAAVANVERPENTFLAKGQAVTQRLESALIERLALLQITHFDGYVINHVEHILRSLMMEGSWSG